MLFLLLGFIDEEGFEAREALYEAIEPREDFLRPECGVTSMFRLLADISEAAKKCADSSY